MRLPCASAGRCPAEASQGRHGCCRASRVCVVGADSKGRLVLLLWHCCSSFVHWPATSAAFTFSDLLPAAQTLSKEEIALAWQDAASVAQSQCLPTIDAAMDKVVVKSEELVVPSKHLAVRQKDHDGATLASAIVVPHKARIIMWHTFFLFDPRMWSSDVGIPVVTPYSIGSHGAHSPAQHCGCSTTGTAILYSSRRKLCPFPYAKLLEWMPWPCRLSPELLKQVFALV